MRKYWGPLYWYMLHSTVNNFPRAPSPNDVTVYNAFLHLFINLIPCSICKEHFTALVHDYPINISINTDSQSNDLKKWAFNAHNIVNAKHKKKIFAFTEYEIVYKNIDHKKISKFVLYVLKQVREKQLDVSKLINLITLLRVIHPCLKCRFKLNKYCKKTKFTKEISIVQLKPWIEKWFNVDRDHSVPVPPTVVPIIPPKVLLDIPDISVNIPAVPVVSDVPVIIS